MRLHKVGWGSFISALALAALATCKVDDHAAPASTLGRATPTSVSDPDGWKLFDRSVSSGYVPSAKPLTVSLGSSQLLLGYKVNGPAPYKLAITGADGQDLGFAPLDLSRLPRGWQTVMSDDPVHADALKLVFTPTGASGPVPELELWSDSDNALGSKVDLTADALPPGYVAFASVPGPDHLSPGSCQDFPLDLSLPPSELVHAYVVYATTGAFRSFSLQRSVNGLAPAGGKWLAGDAAEHVFVDQIDPASLQAGTNTIRLCLPSDATNRVSISHMRVVGELDGGTQFTTSISIGHELRDGNAALDGNTGTVAKVAAGEPVIVDFERLVAPDMLHLVATDNATPTSVECLDRAQHATALRAHRMGADLAIEGATSACASLRLSFGAAADIAELRVIGSGAADRTDWARMVITSAPEHFGDVAWVGGFTVRPQNASGGNHVVISGKASDALLGDFGDIVHRATGNDGSAWSVDVDATFADGSTDTRTIVFDRDERGSLAAAKNGVPAGSTGDGTRFSTPGASVVVHALPADRAQIRLGSSVGVDVPAGAVTKPTDVTVRHLPDATLPPLDPGMVNVTAPKGHGYEFLPHGQRFAKPVETVIPYDTSLIPASMSAEDVHTYFYDPVSKHWQKLDRTSVDVGAQVVHSATNHFTIMINAVLAVPSNPSPMMMDPTSLSSIAAASPAAGIDLVAPPTANSMGDARTGLPVRLPPGRGAYTPSIGFNYSSASENGWMGVGWDLSVSSVSIDTRWGVPTYADGEELRYLLDGAELVPSGDDIVGPSCTDGSTGRRYQPRVEGSFDYIQRCGTDPSNYWFEVTDTRGTRFVYGNDPTRSANASLVSTKPRPTSCGAGCPSGVYRWNINRVDDVHGNETTYTYVVDDITGTGIEPGRDTYLSLITYTSHPPSGLAANYNVDFIIDNGTFRPDKIISGRGGFKQVTRKLLHSVRVRSGSSVVTQYVLTYSHGQFEKTVLTSIKQYGAGGCTVSATVSPFVALACSTSPFLDEHTFSYMTETQGFAAPTTMTVNDDAQTSAPVLGRGTSWTNFGSVSLGVTDGNPQDEVLSVGVNGSIGTRGESVGMYDLNGDGRPDQLYMNGAFTYSYNQGNQFSAAGGPPVDLTVDGGPSLGKENHLSWGIDARGGALGLSVSRGYSNSTSRAKRLLLDADGDGYIDVVDAERTAVKLSGPCASGNGYQCFVSTPFGVLSTVIPTLDPLLSAADQDIRARGIAGDPVVQWTAPYSGKVLIGATVGLLGTSPDGVYVSLYHGDQAILPAPAPVTTVSLPFSYATDPTTPITVIAGESLYLRVANGMDDGSASGGLHDKVNANMSVAYQKYCEDAACLSGYLDPVPAEHEPTGSPVYSFDLHSEQRLVPSAITFPIQGQVRLHGTIVQATTADDVTYCLQKFPAGVSTDYPCTPPSPQDPNYDVNNPINYSHLSKTAQGVPIALLSTSQLIDVGPFDVNQGDRLVLRAESRFSTDPSRMSFVRDTNSTIPVLAYTSVCDPDGTGSCTSTSDPNILSQVPLDLTSFGMYVPPVSGSLPAGRVAHAYIVDSTKPYTVLQFKHPFGGSPAITIAARSSRWGTIKTITCAATYCNTANDFGPLYPGQVGDSLSFEVLGASLPFPNLVSSTVTIQLDSTHQHVVPLIFRDSAQTVTKTPFAGGYRGWRNAFWNENVAPFAPTEIVDDFAEDPSTLSASELQYLQNALQHTIMIPVASTSGTTASVSPAWISKFGDAFIATNGDMNGADIGGGNRLVPGGDLYEGNYARLSASDSYFIGASLSLQHMQIDGTLGATVGESDTTTTTDVVDLNGDGIVDMIAGPYTYAGRISATPGPQLPGLQFSNGLRVRNGYDYSLSGGGAARDTSAAGHVLSMFVPPDRQTTGLGYSNNVALQMGRSQDTDDLIDVNGDGLPDRVQRRGTSIKVQYNLGNQFGTLETFGALDSTMNQAIDTFQSLEQNSIYGFDSTSNALSHETTVTEDDSQVIDVIFARFSKNTHQTSSRTPRQIIDINGDGLPDLVMKKGANIDSSPCAGAPANTQQILVQINRGGDFGPTQCWTTPNWGVALGPSFSSNFASLLLSGAHVISDNDVLAGTSSQQSRTYGGEFVYPIDVVNVHYNFATTTADDTFELALMDIDGDGVADHVLRHFDSNNPNDTTIHVKRNLVTGRANLLQTVHRPLGGSFTLDYTTAGNTQDMPHRRQVLSSVVIDDGVDLGSAFASPNLATWFSYQGGYYHRNEKTFMGFSEVTTQRADGGWTEQYFENKSLPLMGHLKEEIRWGTNASSPQPFKFSDRVLTTRVLDVKGSSGATIAATPECLAALPALLQRVGDVACRPQMPILVEDDTTRSEGGQTKTRRIHVVNLDASGNPKIDHFGNILESTDEVDDAVTTDDTYAAVTYNNNFDYWLIGLPKSIIVRQGPFGAFLRSRSGTYVPGTPDLQTITVTTGTGANPVTTLGYDQYGNLNHITTPANANGEVQTYDITFDTTTQSHPASTQNAFLDKSTATYDLRWGVPLTETDPSGGRLVYTYDKFGRVATVATNYDPTGTATLTMEYHPEESPPRAVTTSVGSAISTYAGPKGPAITTATFIDGLGRTIETRKSAVVGGALGTTTSGAVQLDTMGRVALSYQPTFAGGASTTFVQPVATAATTTGYDKFDRVISVAYPDTPQPATDIMSYDIAPSSRDGLLLFHTTSTDPNSHVRETFTDMADRTREFVEHPDTTTSVTTYDYQATGELKTIMDAETNVTSMAYDERGLRLSMTSPDTGTITQTFDDMGNRLTMKDANHAAAGTTVSYVYSRDRLTQINYPTATKVAKFTYTKGRITGITDETGTRTYVYGLLGEIKEDIRTIKNSSNVNVTFDSKFTYDSLGRQLQVIYPDGTTVTNTYDVGGLLATVVGTGSNWTRTYADDIQYDVYGHRTRIRYGNNVVTTASYDPLRVRLSAVQTTLPSGAQVQNLTYVYDKGSNPKTITNTLAALTSSSGNAPGKSTVSLSYDNADQLLTATGSGDLDATSQSNYTESTTYSPSHNILTKVRDHSIVAGTTTRPAATNFGSTYAYLPAHPHLPDSVGGRHIGYDPNGNPTQRFDINGVNQTLVWDDDNRLIQVIGAFGTQNNIYDSGGLRVRRDSGTQHTIFASQYFDLEGTNQSIKHIYAGGTRVASVLDTNYVGIRNPTPPTTSGTPYFFHDDHLGSTTVVTSDTGTVQESHEFFSDGELWIDRTPASPQNRYLFNGKPFDRDTGFYDFGQRFYDPRSGLWLGADPAFLSTPGEAVSKPMMMSVSAYCAQSPVRITDPDGRDYPSTAAGKALWWAAFKQGGGGHFRDPPNFNWDTYAKGNPSPAEALRTARMAYSPTVADAAGHALVKSGEAAAVAWAVGELLPARIALYLGGGLAAHQLGQGIKTGNGWQVVGGASGLLLAGVGVANENDLPVFEVDAANPQQADLAANMSNALRAGHPSVLTRASRATKVANRNAAMSDGEGGEIPTFDGTQRDEYPFAGTEEGGEGAWVGHVKNPQNSVQGALLKNFYDKYGVKVGDKFKVRIKNDPLGPMK